MGMGEFTAKLWRNPLSGLEGKLERVTVSTALGSSRVLMHRESRKYVRDHHGRMIIGETSDGALMVLNRDGYESVSGRCKRVNEDGVVCVENMFTGEAFVGGLRVRRPVRGPRVNMPGKLATKAQIAAIAGKGGAS